jgi:transposase
VVEVEHWAEIRRMHAIERLSIKEIARRTGRSRVTVRRALRAEEPPAYRRGPVASKLEPHKQEIHRLLVAEPRMPATRIRELIAESGYSGGQTILDVYLREVRPLFAPRPRTFSRTTYRPGEICQFDLWEPSRLIPVGHGQERRGWVVVACLGYSRVGAGALVFSKRAEDILTGITRCLWRLGGLPRTLVWDREGALHAGGGRPSEAFAALCGQLRVGWHLCEAADPQAKGVVERLQGYMETSFEPGRSFANELDFADQLERWFDERANLRAHRTLRCRPIDRLGDERAAMGPRRQSPPTSIRGSSCGCHRIPTCAWTPATTRSIRLWWAAASRCASASARSPASAWTRVRWPAPTPAATPATARSPTSPTPGRCAPAARPAKSPRSSNARWRAMTP